MKKIVSLFCVFSVLFLAGCSHSKEIDDEPYFPLEKDGAVQNNQQLPEQTLIENEYVLSSEEPTSTFSADVDTASYALFRKLVNNGYTFSELKSTAGMNIRTEELVNYFTYSYNQPKAGELFGVKAQTAPCPYNPEAVLLMLGLQTEKAEIKMKNNLVFLIDTSGSMFADDKLGLLKKAFSYLVGNLSADDTVSIVTYAGSERVLLDGCSGAKGDLINKAINELDASGSTNGEAGMKRAYQIAEAHFIPDGNNRIILASDGDLNVGISSVEEIKNFVAEKRDSGVYLSVLGFGTGNYRDSLMETVADNGNGVYYYIDGEDEAEKIFGCDLLSTLYTVAKDVKLQLTFNAEAVKSYRLVGYENRVMNNDDFENDTKDAGELGSGHGVTVCYELILNENAQQTEEWMKLAVRYKKPDEDKSNLNEYSIGKDSYTDNPNDDFKFACSLIELALLLHDSQYKGNITLAGIYSKVSLFQTTDKYRLQYISLLDKLQY